MKIEWMPRDGPKLYGPIKPPEPPNMVWIVFDWKKNQLKPEKEKEVERIAESPVVQMMTKCMSALSLEHEVEKKPSFAQALVSSFEIRDVKPCNDGSHFKILSSYDNDTRKLTLWSPNKPEKYTCHTNSDPTKTTSCPSLTTLLYNSASEHLGRNN